MSPMHLERLRNWSKSIHQSRERYGNDKQDATVAFGALEKKLEQEHSRPGEGQGTNSQVEVTNAFGEPEARAFKAESGAMN